MYVLLLFFTLIIYCFSNQLEIEYARNLNDKLLNDLFNKKIDCIILTNYLSHEKCDDLLKNIKIKKLKNWTVLNSSDKLSDTDVLVTQIPISQVIDGIRKTTEDYINQEDIFSEIDNPIKTIFRRCKDFIIKIGDDELLRKLYPKYNHKFLETILRVYNADPKKYEEENNGMIHNDIDETDLYKYYDIFTINIYLKTPKKGGSLKIWKNIFKSNEVFPKIGDVIIFNPEYYHSVQPFPIGKRISLQSFILKHKNSNRVNIRA